MTTSGTDPLIPALTALVAPAPPTLADRVFAQWVRVEGPTGGLYVAFTDRGISYVRTAEAVADDEVAFTAVFRDRFGRPLRPAGRAPAGLVTALRTGRGRTLSFDLREVSEFEQAVLRAALDIPRGETRPYAWVAHAIGRPRAVRAVGSALGRNPVPVLIPCHRVTRSDGRVGEYVFGTETKERLLHAEDVDLARLRELAAAGVHYLGSDTTGVVCYPTCHNARRITAKHRHGFGSLRTATQAGYRPCEHCRPVLAA